jgi:Flp pilus assembly pilin Flp
MSLGLRERIVSFARERALATDCALIAAAIAVAIVAQFIAPLFKKHDTLFATLMRIFS